MFQKTHGMSGTKPYNTWINMISRCYKKTNKRYYCYGARGIVVCDRWLESFENFWEDMKNTYSKELTLDRINTNGNYEPGNCRWATWKDQSRTRRNTNLITFNGRTKTISEWSKETGIKSRTIYDRLKKGWSTKLVLSKKLYIKP